MKRTIKSLLAAAGMTAAFFTAIPAMAATYPNAAEAVTLKNAINNNTIAGHNVGNNNTTIAFYLPRMFDCQPVYQMAVNAMNAEFTYIAGGGSNAAIINGFRSQVNSALAGGDNCSQPSLRPAGDVFNANGVKYTNVGWPSLTFINPVILTSNNFPPNLRAAQVAAYNSGFKFYIYRTPDDFKASPLYATLHVTQTEYDALKVRSAFTLYNEKVQVLFQNFYNISGTTLVPFTVFPATAVITHETEHVNDARLGTPSLNDSGFVAAYNLGVARYNAAPATKDPDIGLSFVTNSNGKSELFTELATYWDTGHWSVSGVSAQMSGVDYSAAEVLSFFPEAWAYMQAKKQSGAW